MIDRGLSIGIERYSDEPISKARQLSEDVYEPFDGLKKDFELSTVQTEKAAPQGDSEAVEMLRMILAWLQENWPTDGEPQPIVLSDGTLVGYYDRQLGVRTNMRRRGVI